MRGFVYSGFRYVQREISMKLAPYSPGRGNTETRRPAHTGARGTPDPALEWTGHTADPPRAAGSDSPEPTRGRWGNTPAGPGRAERWGGRRSAPSCRGQKHPRPRMRREPNADLISRVYNHRRTAPVNPSSDIRTKRASSAAIQVQARRSDPLDRIKLAYKNRL